MRLTCETAEACQQLHDPMLEATMVLMVAVPLALATLDVAWQVYKGRGSDGGGHTQR